MTKLKFIKTGIILLCITLCLTGCSGYSEAETFSARAAFTISRHLGSASKFNINYIEYHEEGEMRRVLADCTLFYTGNTFEKYVFIVGIGGEYFEECMADEMGILNDVTGLYIMNFGDTSYNTDPDAEVDKKVVLAIFNEYVKKGDPALLGME